MRFSKPPLTVAAQIQLLHGRGMLMADVNRTERVLEHINYYRLRAYWLPFETTRLIDPESAEHAFAPNTQFDEVVGLYVFDRQLRVLLMEAIERVEIAIRTHWSQTLAQRYGSHAYLQADVFQNQRIQEGCLKSLDEELERSKETFVQHYRSKYSEPTRPPIWATCELLTLGQLSKWLNNVKLRSDRQAMAQHFGLDEVVVCAFAHHLTHVRNLCAHHCRVWNRKLTLTMTLPKRPDALAKQFNAYEQRRIYNSLVMLAWCIRVISPESTWPLRLRELLKTRKEAQLKSMGVPAHWQDAPVWR